MGNNGHNGHLSRSLPDRWTPSRTADENSIGAADDLALLEVLGCNAHHHQAKVT
jgi:hypothetical protein